MEFRRVLFRSINQNLRRAHAGCAFGTTASCLIAAKSSLPFAVRGSSLRKSHCLGVRMPSISRADWRRTLSCADASSAMTSAVTNSSPQAALGTPNTVHSRTPARRDRKACTSAGYIRSEEHTSELQSLMRISYAVFCLKKKKHTTLRPHLKKQHRATHTKIKH